MVNKSMKFVLACVFAALQPCSSQTITERQKRWALRDRTRLWNNGIAGDIPYRISNAPLYVFISTDPKKPFFRPGGVQFGPGSRAFIRHVLSKMPFCGRFVETNDTKQSGPRIVYKLSQESFVTSLGKGSPMVVRLRPNFELSDLLHETMHALGFDHEHARYDRDKYVKLRERFNGRHRSFARSSRTQFTDLGFPYDNRSVLHYSSRILEPKHGQKLGGDHLSVLDVLKLNRLYRCENHCRCTFQNRQIYATATNVNNPKFCPKLCKAKFAWKSGLTTAKEFIKKYRPKCKEIQSDDLRTVVHYRCAMIR